VANLGQAKRRREGKVLKKGYWGFVLLLGSADIALAQTTSNIPPVVGAAPRINPGTDGGRRIGIRAGVEASYDSNVFGISEARGRELNVRNLDDVSITPSLQLDILLPTGRHSVYARGAIGYDFYIDNTRLNRERINLDAGGTFQATSSCSVSPNINYGRFRSNAGDIFVRDLSGVGNDIRLARRNVQESATIGAQAACGRASGLSATLGYRHTTFRNSTELFQQNDLNQDAVDGSIGFQRPSLGRIALYGNYAEVEYLNRLLIDGSRDALKSYGAGIQFQRDIGSRVSAAISAGYTWVEPRGGGDFSGSAYSASLNLRPSNRFSVDLLASRSVDFANTFFASFTITEVYALNGTYRLTPRLALNFGSSFQTRDFRFSGVQLGTINSDKFIRAYGGVIFDLNRRLKLNALVSQQRRDSTDVFAFNNSIFDYTNTTVSIGASLALGR
jgi:hypothetical protein